MEDLNREYSSVIRKAINLRETITDQQADEQTLISQLPRSPGEVAQLEQTVALLHDELRRSRLTHLEAREQLADAYVSARDTLAATTQGVVTAFAKIIARMIAEDAQLIQGTAPARITQDGGLSRRLASFLR